MDTSEHRTKTLDFFQRIALEKAGYYDAQSAESPTHTRWQLLVRRRLHNLLKLMKDTHSNLVDVGCGRGDFVFEIAKMYPEFDCVGRDFSPEMVDIALKEYGATGNLRYEVSDLLESSEKPELFDIVLCLNMFHHLHPDQHLAGLKSLAKSCKKTIIFEIKPSDCFWNRYFRPDSGFPFSLINQAFAIKALEKEGFTLQSRWHIFYVRFLSPIAILEFNRVSPL